MACSYLRCLREKTGELVLPPDQRPIGPTTLGALWAHGSVRVAPREGCRERRVLLREWVSLTFGPARGDGLMG